jgi:hypothetical protein
MPKSRPDFKKFIYLFDGLNYKVDVDKFNKNTKIEITCQHKHTYITSITKILSLNHDYKNCPHCKKNNLNNNKKISIKEIEEIFHNTTYEVIDKKEFYSKWDDEIILRCKSDKNIERIKVINYWVENGKKIPICSECIKSRVLTDENYIKELDRIKQSSFFDIQLPESKYNSEITANVITFISKTNWHIKEYNGTKNKSTFICNICGFEKNTNVYNLRNCINCEKNNLKNGVKNKLYDICKSSNIFINQEEIYKDVNSPIKFKCNVCSHEFENSWACITGKYYNVHCPECYSSTKRKSQNELYNFIKSNYEGTINPDDRTLISPKELDIYIPDKNIAFEYCGNIWHSEKFNKDKNYHYDKMSSCLEKGVQLITIFEDEWKLKNDICKSRILNLIGIQNNSIYARNCSIVDISLEDAKTFLNKNHLQGYCFADNHYGLMFNNDIVSIMSFKNTEDTEKPHNWELVRFANTINYRVVGSASKLLSHFINLHKNITLSTFSDSRWSNGSFYEKIGFKFDYDIDPSYYYVGNHTNWKLKHRFTYNKNRLIEIFKETDIQKTEHQIALENGLYRIYDCGHKKFSLTT